MLRCNVGGQVKVRFRGPRSRTVTTRLSMKDGTASIATRRFAGGSYRVTVWAGEVRLETPFKVRVR
jgi:hypothetical protein